MEVCIRGTVTSEDIPQTLTLLKAICSETGYLGDFRENERVLKPKDGQGTMRGSPYSKLRTRYLISGQNFIKKWSKYSIKYYGHPDRRIPLPCEKKPFLDVTVDSDPLEFLEALGYTMEFEFIRNGYRFIAQKDIFIQLYTVEILLEKGNFEKVKKFGVDDDDEELEEELRTGPSWVFEIIKTGSVDRALEPGELMAFANNFSSLLSLPKPPKK